MDEMLHHTRAVRRAVRHALLVVDMPFGSYHAGAQGGGERRALRQGRRCRGRQNRGRHSRVPLIRHIIGAEIPVIGHIGLTPQSVHRMGGYKVQGKTVEAIDALLADAAALDAAGVSALVLEGIPREVAARITARLLLPPSALAPARSAMARSWFFTISPDRLQSSGQFRAPLLQCRRTDL